MLSLLFLEIVASQMKRNIASGGSAENAQQSRSANFLKILRSTSSCRARLFNY